MRLPDYWKNQMPKGNFRNVQKAINDKLKEISVIGDWAGQFKGYTEFDYDITIFKKFARIKVYLIIEPPEESYDLGELYFSIARYERKAIPYKLTFVTAGYGKPAHYHLRFPYVKVPLKNIPKPKTHAQVVREIGEEIVNDIVPLLDMEDGIHEQ